MANKGRPIKNDISKKDVKIMIRMSQVEKERLKTVAAFYKTSLSETIRLLINRELLAVLRGGDKK